MERVAGTDAISYTKDMGMNINKYTALASAVRNVSGTADIGALPGDFVEMNIYIAVTAASSATGTPSMTVTYQCSHDGTTWFDHTSGAAITAVTNQVIKITSNLGKYGRISYAISGDTPSFTFSAVAEAKRSE